jgi:hypothetical protein
MDRPTSAAEFIKSLEDLRDGMLAQRRRLTRWTRITLVLAGLNFGFALLNGGFLLFRLFRH